MAKNSREAYNADSTTSLLGWDPEKLHLVVDPKSPLFDERVHLPVSEKMVRSIMHMGVIQPISVVKNPETGAIEVVAGRQRVKNAREANKRLVAQGREPIEVPGYTRKYLDGGAKLADVMVTENEIREADTPIGRAKKMAAIRERSGRDDAYLAVLFGCSEATVRSLLALLDCTADVQNAVDAGKIGLGHAAKLAPLEPAQQRAKVAELVKAGDGVTAREKVAKQRAIVGDTKPKMKSRKEIILKRDACSRGSAERNALDWVLGA
jgi:ParB family chromosome partitioning protein